MRIRGEERVCFFCLEMARTSQFFYLLDALQDYFHHQIIGRPETKFHMLRVRNLNPGADHKYPLLVALQ